ncbi:MAG TPA: sigma-70 family RNA polymerase sigma factor [Solirubrobacteraceae bacterium]|jgi:RNA polymerase sigma-70 factor (ECF subfamily)|nr:sigma-70 family RNA polymerase sigma factor [Solirubrobacteraceae bacterium]
MDEDLSGTAGREAERFERLYEQHFNAVAAYLLARVDREAAADALAATFEVAWRRIGEVPSHELAWLLGVARRVLANARRSRARQAALLERMIAATPSAPSVDDGDGALAAELANAIAQLTAQQQEALLLIAWDGLSEREAALALGCSREAFAARLHRARSRVRAAIDPSRRGGSAPQKPSNQIQIATTTEEAI